MMSDAIEPRESAYGKYADASAVADYLELLALHGRYLSRADLSDLLADTDWKVRDADLFRDSGDPPAEEEEPEADADAGRVFDLFDERARVLGRRYPFRVAQERLVPSEEGTEVASYFSLLAITVAHAYGLDCPVEPTEVFEDVVVDVLSVRGFEAVNLGARARGSVKFEDAVIAAGNEIRLRPTPWAGSAKVYAQDSKADAIGHLWWGDERAGAWTVVGQATCGKSEDWERKLAEPPAPLWEKYLGVLILPQVVLAVPHHAHVRHLFNLTESHGRLVLDRLRLVRYRSHLSASEEAVIACVADATVWQP
jgi:hypothetical protein